MASAEFLESRITPASAAFGGGTLTIAGTAGGDSVVVAIGQVSTRVSINNVLLATVSGATHSSITTIDLNGAGGGQTLTIMGNTPSLNAINFTGGASNLVVSANATPTGGTLTVDAGAATLNLGSPNPLVTNDFVNVIGNLLINNATALTDSGRISVSGELEITTAGNVTLDHAGNNYGSLDLDAATILIIESGSTLLEDIDATGTLTVTSSGPITDGAGGVNVVGDTTLTATSTAANITLDNAGNTFGLLTLTAGEITIVEAADTDLGAVTASRGALNVTSTGAINDNAAISVINGRATFSAGGGGIIDLSDFGHRFKSVSLLTAGNAELNEADSTELFTTTVGGNLTVVSLGAITDVGSVLTTPPTVQNHSIITVTGTTTLTPGGANPVIVLDSALNDFVGDVSFSGSNVTLVDVNAIDLGPAVITGNLKVTAGGAVVDDGALTVPGRATIDAVGSDITFDASTFGALELRGANVSITETGGTDFLTSTITGTLTVNATGNITNGVLAGNVPNYSKLNVTGATSLTATGDITILAAGQVLSSFGTLTLNAVNINITEHNAADLGAVVATGNFTLTVRDGVAQPAPLGGGITQQGGTIVDVTGVATFDAIAKYDINLPNANEFGSLIFSGRNVTINEADATVLGARASTTSTLGSVVYGNLALTSGGSITQTAVAAQTFGKLVVQGTASIQSGPGAVITLDRLDPISPLLAAPNAVANQFGILQLTTTGADTADVTVLEAGATNLGTTNLVGDLTLTSTGPITDSGVLTIAGATILNAGAANTIVLDSDDGTFNRVPTNDLQGPISLTGRSLILKNTGTVGGTVLGAITTAGNFDVYSTTAISNPTLAISVGGKGFFTTTAEVAAVADNVDLGTTALANFGSLSVVGAANLTLDEGSATALGPITITGDLDVDSTGNITDVGRILVTGSTIVETTGGFIILDTSNNNFDVGGSGDTFIFNATGNVTIVDAAGGIIFGASTGLTLTVTAVGGSVTDVGTLTIGAGVGAVNVTALNNLIELDDAANTYGTLTLKGATATIVDAGALSIGPSTIQLNNARGALNLTAAGNITQTGAILAGAVTLEAGTFDILLTNANNRFDAVTTTGADDLSITENEAVVLGTTNLDGGGTAALTVIAKGSTAGPTPATISQTGPIDANATSLNASTTGAITLNDPANSFGVLIMIGSSISITEDDNATNGGAAGTALGATTATRSLTVNADGAVTTVGTLNVAGLAAVTTTGDQVDLGTATANFGSVSVLGSGASDVTIIEGSATTLATVVILGGGNLSVTSAGAITDTGLISVQAGGTTTLSAGLGLAAVTLDTTTNDFTGTVTFNGTNVTLVDANAIDLDTSAPVTTLTVRATGAITQTGDLDVTGATSFNAGTANDITLNDAGNTFGTLTLVGNNVSLTDSTAVELAASTIVGTFDLVAGGAVTQTGSINGGTTPMLAATGAVDINANAGASAITLTATNNSFGALTLNGSNVSIREAAVIDVAAITAGGAVLSLHSTASATDAIIQTGAISAAGAATTLTATGTDRDILLANAANEFGALTISGDDVTIAETNGIVVTTASVTGDLDLTATTSIASTGTVNVAGTVDLTAGTTITFGNTSSTFGVLTLSGTNISITEQGSSDLGAINATGSLDIAAGGAINDFGVITVGTTSSFSTAHPALGAGAAITLDQASTFTGAVSLAGTNVSITNTVATELDNVTATGTLSVTSGGDITNSAGGSISVTGIATLNANAGADDILLNNGGTTAFSTVLLNATDVELDSELDGIILGTSTVLGDLTLTMTSGGITDSGVLMVTGTTTLNAAGETIIFDNVTSQFGIGVPAAGDFVITAGTVSIRDAGPVTLGNIVVTVGDFMVTSGLGAADDITQIGGATVMVTGFSTFNAGLGDVIIANGGNVFTGGRVGIGALVNIVP